MALFIRQNDNRSQLQERLATELQERMRNSDQDTAKAAEKMKRDPAILDNQHKTSSAGIIVFIIAVVVIGLAFWLLRP